MNILKAVLSLTLLAAGSASLVAQDQLPLRGPAAERIEQYKKVRMMEELKLDEQTSIKFFARYNSHREELRKLNEKRNELIDELQVLHRRDASDAEFKKVLDELKELAEPAVELREKYFAEMAEVLSPKQLAEYFIFERKFIQNLRDIMRDMQRERRGRR